MGWSLVAGPVPMVVGRFMLHRDMKMEGDGMLLIRLVSRSSPVFFAGVGGWGAGLPDSSSDGSLATWAPVRGVGVSCGFQEEWGELTRSLFFVFLIHFGQVSRVVL